MDKEKIKNRIKFNEFAFWICAITCVLNFMFAYFCFWLNSQVPELHINLDIFWISAAISIFGVYICNRNTEYLRDQLNGKI